MEILNRAKALERQGRSIVHMEIGEPDFPTPANVIEAANAFISTGAVRYTAAAGLLELRESLAELYLEHYGIEIGSERIFITPGASGGFLLATGLLVNSGDKVLFADPGYPCYANFVQLFAGSPQRVAVDTATNFQLTADLVSQFWDNRTTGVIVASPSNPTGTIIDPAELQRIVAFTEKRSGFLLSDEVYHGLEYNKAAVSALALSDQAFIVNSFSKYFGMTGWRIGWLIVPEKYTKPVESMAQNFFISAPAHSQYAALAALSSSNFAELEKRRLEFQQRRDFLYTKLAGLGFRLPAKPDGAFYLYADCSNFTSDSYALAFRLLDDAGVAVAPGKDFGKYNAARYLRFAYTASTERLAEGIRRLENFFAQTS